ncbi:MAG: hypothetical protein ACJ77L_02345 [Solirubrobacteraceae bacterium]
MAVAACGAAESRGAAIAGARAAHSIESGLVVCVAHSPISPAPDLVKVRTHEVLHELLAAISTEPVALCATSTRRGASIPTGPCGRSRASRVARCDRSAASGGTRRTDRLSDHSGLVADLAIVVT